MNHERHIPSFLKIVIAATGAAVVLSGGPLMPSPPQGDNSTPTDTKGTHTEWLIGPCSPNLVAPWKDYVKKINQGSLVITLASVVPPNTIVPVKPKEQPECWYPVEIPNTSPANQIKS
jgi:hypothetical protein